MSLGPGGAEGTEVDGDGRWRMSLRPQQAGLAFGTGRVVLNTLDGTHRVILEDVLFGEVWLCTG